jgi:excisionase family DNA binding protein
MPVKSKTPPKPVIEQLDSYLSREQAAEKLGVSAQSIGKHIKSGALCVHRLGRRVLIRPSEIIRLVEGE